MPSTSTSGYTPFGVFAKFPQEVRDLIYGLVLADGQNALIRTSKAMYANTAQSLSKHGVYCAHIEHYRHLPRNICTHCRPLAWKILSAVQNFHLHLTIGGKSLWDKKHHDPAYATNLLTIFMRDIVNAMKNPVYCKLSLEMMHPDRLGTPILRMISALKVFKEVKVELWHKEDTMISRPVNEEERCVTVSKVRSALEQGMENGIQKKFKVVWTDPESR